MTLSARARWHIRANSIVLVWLAAAAVAAASVPVLDTSEWLVVHLLLLGAVTNAIVIWTDHFVTTLMLAPAPSRRNLGARLALLNLAIIVVIGGVEADSSWLTATGATAFSAVIVWHVVSFSRFARKGRLRRWADTWFYYAGAGAALLGGALTGTLLVTGDGDYDRIYLEHLHLNLLGWVALTVLGTLFTLWPTVLRTQMVPGVEPSFRPTFGLTFAGLIAAVAGIEFDLRALAVAGLAAYAAGVIVSLVPFARTARRRTPRGAAAVMMAASTIWLAIVVVVDLVAVATQDVADVVELFEDLLPVVVLGFAVQVVIGAMTFLLPAVIGGGPARVRRTTAIMERQGTWRAAILNLGVALVALPLPDALTATGGVLIGLSIIVFLALSIATMLVTREPRYPDGGPESMTSDGPDGMGLPGLGSRGSSRSGVMGGVAMGLGMLLVAVTVAMSGGADEEHSVMTEVTPTGDTTTVEVSLGNMTIDPKVIEVPAGDRLVLEVTNTDSMTHDLKVENGPQTRMLKKGESQTLDAGVVGQDFQVWCTVPGHRQAGMEADVKVIGGGHAADDPAVAGENNGSGGASHSMPTNGEPAPGWEPYPAELEPAPDATEHNITLRAQEKVVEIAPGVRQQIWTYNGTMPGPTLRGKVGDVFNITLVNEGKLGHSIDFHAGFTSPDRPMRTIQPGEKLTYRFKATKSGMWMYHCATAPVLHHIGNGMYGAVIIDPPDLPKVDHEYVIVQSEQFWGPDGQPQDYAKMQAEDPDAVVFNGYPDQYTYEPLKIKAGERVRFWVLNVGPNRSTAFHVIGGQFDTVFKEGTYQLTPDNPYQGGSQALGLEASQGGFVELTFEEPGSYTFLSHRFVDAERGASGIIKVE